MIIINNFSKLLLAFKNKNNEQFETIIAKQHMYTLTFSMIFQMSNIFRYLQIWVINRRSGMQN